MIAIRAPHGRRSRNVKVVRSRKTSLETGLLVLAWIGFFIPLIWLASPVLSFAEYPLRPGPLVAGVICLVIGLWLFYKSHADLGTNWSITLEVREQHRLITQGVYRRIRHPMVLGIGAVFCGPGARHPELGRRSVELSRVRDPVRASCSCGRTDDERRRLAMNTQRTRHERSDLFLGSGRQEPANTALGAVAAHLSRVERVTAARGSARIVRPDNAAVASDARTDVGQQ